MGLATAWTSSAAGEHAPTGAPSASTNASFDALRRRRRNAAGDNERTALLLAPEDLPGTVDDPGPAIRSDGDRDGPPGQRKPLAVDLRRSAVSRLLVPGLDREVASTHGRVADYPRVVAAVRAGVIEPDVPPGSGQQRPAAEEGAVAGPPEDLVL